jgi:hypothetical protein
VAVRSRCGHLDIDASEDDLARTTALCQLLHDKVLVAGFCHRHLLVAEELSVDAGLSQECWSHIHQRNRRLGLNGMSCRVVSRQNRWPSIQPEVAPPQRMTKTCEMHSI